MRPRIFTWVKRSPVAYPAEFIDLAESLRADVDAWKIGRRLPGESLPRAIARSCDRASLDADTAVAYHHKWSRKLQ